jgi:uncharacterized protein (TIGR03437 family)
MSSRIAARAVHCALFSLLLGAFPSFAQFVPNRYTLLLEDAPVSSRFVSREAMRSSPAIAYQQQIEAKQRKVLGELASRNVQVTGSDATLVNAIFVIAPASRLDELKSIPGVAAVRPMRRFKAALNRATQLMNAPPAWNALGGVANAGKGIKIGIIDSGIDQTHPAFQDSTLTMPAGFPLCSGSADACNYTSNKVIVARSYVRQLAGFTSRDPANLPDDTSVPPPPSYSTPDDYSPRDHFGHGTAVASSAAANTNTGTVTFTGMAPKAYLGNYKLAGSPGVNDGPTDDVMILAVKDALQDGMDIASLSWGALALTGALDTGAVCGNPAGQPCDPVAWAYEAAAKAGLVITVAAGNSGEDAYNYNGNYPYFDSISSPATAPSVIGVGASTNSHVLTPAVSVNAANAPANLKGIAAQPSDATFYPSSNGANQAPLIDVTQLGNDGLACTALPANSLNGVYALIKRSINKCSFSVKASNAQLAGATGVIFYMEDSSATIVPSASQFIGPVVMISNSDGLALKSYIDANPGQMVTIDAAGAETDLATYVQQMSLSPAAANQLASYSSFGPTPDGAIKPDLVATGGFDGSIAYSYGLYLAAQNYDPNGILYSMNRYAAADGTSFATPIVAGAAALVKQAHPSYTPGQIKSALANYAAQDTTTDDFGLAVNVLGVGAGRLDAGAAINAAVTAEPATVSFGILKSGVLPITKPITITNKGTTAVTLAVAAAPASSAAGTAVGVDKPSLTLGPAGSSTAAATLNVTLSGSLPKAGSYSGAVTLAGSGVSMRLPYLFLVGSGVTDNVVPVMGSLQGTPGENSGAIGIQLIDTYGVPVTGASVSFSVSPAGALTFQSVPGEPACSPNNSTTTTACATDNYGIAYVEVIMGPRTGTPVVTARAAGLSLPFDAYILPQPAINAGGVVNAASYQAPVAPGSYVSIFGSNMVETDLLSNASGDGASWLPLPMVIDGVNVSFDVPSAGISVPGNLIFVSPGQINVQVPWEIEGQSSALVKVTVDEMYGYPLFGNVVSVPLATYAPAFFVGIGTGTIAAQDAITGANILASNPARPGEILALYANGLGPVTNPPASGSPASASPLSETPAATPVVVTIAGQQAYVGFSGLAPGYPGLYQINATVPAGLTGNQQVTVSIGGQTSPAVVLPVR